MFGHESAYPKSKRRESITASLRETSKGIAFEVTSEFIEWPL